MIMPSQKESATKICVFRACLQIELVIVSFVGDLSVQVKDFSGYLADTREVVQGRESRKSRKFEGTKRGALQ